MIVTGLLDYEHILPVYFALAIPWMSSPSGRDSLTKAVLLPRANQSSSCVCRWGTTPCPSSVSVAVQPVFLWGTTPRTQVMRYSEYYLLSGRFIGTGLCFLRITKLLLRLVIYGYEATNNLLVPMGGIEPPAFRL